MDFADFLRGVLQGSAPLPELTAVRTAGRFPAPRPRSTKPVEEQATGGGPLPGEEQVTTADTLGQLTPDERRGLKAKYTQSGMAGKGGTETFEDWAGTHFGEMPPGERLSAMQRAAGMRLPPETIVPQEEVQPGKNSRMAQARVNAGGVLPEGRDPSQYSAGQRYTMGRNVHNPLAAMTPFGGTNVHNPDGSLSARAPRPSAMARVGELGQKDGVLIPAGPDGQFSDEQILRLGQAYNIDVGQYGNDTDLLRADVMREHERHSRLAKKYNAIPNHMGGYRYTPNDAMKADEQRRKTRSFASSVLERFARTDGVAPEEIAELRRLQAEGEGEDDYQKVVALGLRLGSQRRENSNAVWRQNLASEKLTRDMRNPERSLGLQIRSLQRALQNGNLPSAAGVGMVGRFPGWEAFLGLEAERQKAAATVAAAEAEHGGNNPNRTGQDIFGPEYAEALNVSDPAQQFDSVSRVMAKDPASQGLTAPQKEARAHEIIASHEGRRGNVQHPSVKRHLEGLVRAGNPTAFNDFAEGLGITHDEAVDMWNSGLSLWGRWTGYWQNRRPPAGSAPPAAASAGPGPGGSPGPAAAQ